jgi:hypothetical protein
MELRPRLVQSVRPRTPKSRANTLALNTNQKGQTKPVWPFS